MNEIAVGLVVAGTVILILGLAVLNRLPRTIRGPFGFVVEWVDRHFAKEVDVLRDPHDCDREKLDLDDSETDA